MHIDFFKMIPIKSPLVFSLIIFLVGINLRPSIASLSPLTKDIEKLTTLNDFSVSFLTTLPIWLIGLLLLITPFLHKKLGERRGVALALLLLAGTFLLRWINISTTTLLISSVLSGLGIALGQSLIPIFIKEHTQDQTARYMAIYSTAIMAGALVSSAISPWIALNIDMSTALGFWLIITIIGYIVWKQQSLPDSLFVMSDFAKSVIKKPRFWLLVLFMGLGTGIYTIILAWLPPFYTQLGWTSQKSGLLLSFVTASEVLAGTSISFFISHYPDRRPIIWFFVSLLIIGLTFFCYDPIALAWVAALFTGLGIGALFPLSLIVAMDHGKNTTDAGSLSGFVQGGAYLLASIFPLIAGVIEQFFSNLRLAWGLMILVSLIIGLLAFRFSPKYKFSLYPSE
ncbi:MFS transporter [Swingsia samuiensis]|uniref:MFS transporter n=1 Tax=Swingsia samuiensis TaxID=1293412 RepID=A0A4Y6UJV5_9PROT|nr:MFS transporter [Swingsia samuiensis]QDH17873.1 MFS transporter [Swingsia samuiensis]